MDRVKAYHILGEMWSEALPEQKEALVMAQADIEFVDLMGKTVDPIHYAGGCYCRECELWHRYTVINRTFGICKKTNIETGEKDFCSYGRRKEGTE